MKQAFIILAHKNPVQLKRLITALQSPFFDFYIHLDSRLDIDGFVTALEKGKVNVHFIKPRTQGKWGGLGIVLGTLNAIREIINSNQSYSHIHLLSGQDYPIKPVNDIYSFFRNQPDTDFIEYESFPVKHMAFGGRDRSHHYSMNIFGKRQTYLPFKYCSNLSIKGKVMNSFLGIVQFVLPKRKIPDNFTPFYGSQWWSLSQSSAEKILRFVDSNPTYIKYHQYSLLPDEMFFQTILLNIDTGNSLINDNKRFIKWNNESSHPISLSSSHLSEINTSEKLFARKFEMNDSVLNIIDNNLRNEKSL
jgi:hypothetical protein